MAHDLEAAGSSTRTGRRAAPGGHALPQPHRAILDGIPAPVAVVDRCGRILHGNPLLLRLVHGPDADPSLLDDLAALGRSLGCGAGASAGEATGAGRRHRLMGQALELHQGSEGMVVLIVVQAASGVEHSDEYLRRRFGLTPKEAMVARMLAQGRSNRGIAASLCISQSTARHHTERVLAKVGAKSRAGVGARLREAAEPLS